MRNSNSLTTLTTRTSQRSSCLRNYFDYLKEFENNKTHLIIDEPKKSIKKFKEDIYDKYSSSIEKYIKKNKRSIYLSGSTKYGELPIDSFITELQSYKKTILQKIKENPSLMPLFNELEGDEIILTPLPEQTHRLILDKKKEKNDYDAAKRTAVVMRIVEYTHRFKRKDKPPLHNSVRTKQIKKKAPMLDDDHKVLYVMKNAVDRIEKWWKYTNKIKGKVKIRKEIQDKTFNDHSTHNQKTLRIHNVIIKTKKDYYYTKRTYTKICDDTDKIIYLQSKIKDFLLQRKQQIKCKKIKLIKKVMKKPKLILGYYDKVVYDYNKIIIKCQRNIKRLLHNIRKHKESLIIQRMAEQEQKSYSIIIKKVKPIIMTKEIKYICALDEYINNNEFLQKVIRERKRSSQDFSISSVSCSKYNKSHRETVLSSINNSLYSYYCHLFFHSLQNQAKLSKRLRKIIFGKTRKVLSKNLYQWRHLSKSQSYTATIQLSKANNYVHLFHYKTKKIKKKNYYNIFSITKGLENIVRICKIDSWKKLKENQIKCKSEELLSLMTINSKRKIFYRLLLIQLMDYYEKNKRELIRNIIQRGTDDNVLKRISQLKQLDIKSIKHKNKKKKYIIYVDHLIKEEDNEDDSEDSKESTIKSNKSNHSIIIKKDCTNELQEDIIQVSDSIKSQSSIKSNYSIQQINQFVILHKSIPSNHSVKSHHSDIVIISMNSAQINQLNNSIHSNDSEDEIIVADDYSDSSSETDKEDLSNDNAFNNKLPSEVLKIITKRKQSNTNLHYLKTDESNDNVPMPTRINRNYYSKNNTPTEKSSVSVDRIRHVPYKPKAKKKGMIILLRDTNMLYHDNNI